MSLRIERNFVQIKASDDPNNPSNIIVPVHSQKPIDAKAKAKIKEAVDGLNSEQLQALKKIKIDEDGYIRVEMRSITSTASKAPTTTTGKTHHVACRFLTESISTVEVIQKVYKKEGIPAAILFTLSHILWCILDLLSVFTLGTLSPTEEYYQKHLARSISLLAAPKPSFEEFAKTLNAVGEVLEKGRANSKKKKANDCLDAKEKLEDGVVLGRAFHQAANGGISRYTATSQLRDTLHNTFKSKNENDYFLLATGSEEEQFIPSLLKITNKTQPNENLTVEVVVSTSYPDGTHQVSTLEIQANTLPNTEFMLTQEKMDTIYEHQLLEITNNLSNALFIASTKLGTFPTELSETQQAAERQFAHVSSKEIAGIAPRQTRLELALGSIAEGITKPTETTETKSSNIVAIQKALNIENYDLEAEVLHGAQRSLLKFRGELLQQHPNAYLDLFRSFKEQVLALKERITAEKNLTAAEKATDSFIAFIEMEEAEFPDLRLKNPQLQEAVQAPLDTKWDVVIKPSPVADIQQVEAEAGIIPIEIFTHLQAIKPCITTKDVIEDFTTQLGALENVSNQIDSLLNAGKKKEALNATAHALRALPSPELLEAALASGKITLDQIEKYQKCIEDLSSLVWEAKILLLEPQPFPSEVLALVKGEVLLTAITRAKAKQLLQKHGIADFPPNLSPQDVIDELKAKKATDQEIITIMLGICPKQFPTSSKVVMEDLCLRSFNPQERAQINEMHHYIEKQASYATRAEIANIRDLSKWNKAWEGYIFSAQITNSNTAQNATELEILLNRNAIDPSGTLDSSINPQARDWIAMRRQSLYLQSVYSPEAYLYQGFANSGEALLEVGKIFEQARAGRTLEETLEAGPLIQYQNVKAKLRTCKRLALVQNTDGPQFGKFNNRICEVEVIENKKVVHSSRVVADIYSTGFPKEVFRREPKANPMAASIGNLPPGMLSKGESYESSIGVINGSPTLAELIQVTDNPQTKLDPLVELALNQMLISETRITSSNQEVIGNSFASAMQGFRLALLRPDLLKDRIVARRVVQAILGSNSLNGAMLQCPQAMQTIHSQLKTILKDPSLASESKATLELLLCFIEQEAKYLDTTLSKINETNIEEWGHLLQLISPFGNPNINTESPEQVYFGIINTARDSFKNIVGQATPTTIDPDPKAGTDIASATMLLRFFDSYSSSTTTTAEKQAACIHYAILKTPGKEKILPDLSREMIERFELQILPDIISSDQAAQKQYITALSNAFELTGNIATFLDALDRVTSKKTQAPSKTVIPLNIRIHPMYCSVFGGLKPEVVPKEQSDGTTHYIFEYQGKKCTIIYDPDKETVSLKMTIDNTEYEHRNIQTVSRHLSQQSLLSNLKTLGVWVEVNRPTHAIAFLDSFDKLPEKVSPLTDTFQIHWARSSSLQPEITFGKYHVASTLTEAQRELEHLATEGNLLFLTDSKGNLKQIKIRSPDWTLQCDREGNVFAPALGANWKLNLHKSSSTKALGSMASKIAMTFEHGRKKAFLLCPRQQNTATPSFTLGAAPLIQGNNYILMRVSDGGELSGGGCGFLYLAYLNLKEKNYSKAANMLQALHQRGQFDPADEKLFEAIAKEIFSMQPTNSYESAFLLKAALQIEGIRREKFGKYTTAFTPAQLQEEKEILRAWNAYSKLSTAQNDALKLLGLGLTPQEESILQSIEKNSPFTQVLAEVPKKQKVAIEQQDRLTTNPDALVKALLASNSKTTKFPLQELLTHLNAHPGEIFDYYLFLAGIAANSKPSSPAHIQLVLFCNTMLSTSRPALPLIEEGFKQAILSLNQMLLLAEQVETQEQLQPKKLNPPNEEDFVMIEGTPSAVHIPEGSPESLLESSWKFSIPFLGEKLRGDRDQASRARKVALDGFFTKLMERTSTLPRSTPPRNAYIDIDPPFTASELIKIINSNNLNNAEWILKIHAIALQDSSPKPLETWLSLILSGDKVTSQSLLQGRLENQIANAKKPEASTASYSTLKYEKELKTANAIKTTILECFKPESLEKADYSSYQTQFSIAGGTNVQNAEMKRIQAGFGACQVTKNAQTSYNLSETNLGKLESRLPKIANDLQESRQEQEETLLQLAREYSTQLGLDPLFLLETPSEKILLALLDLYESGALANLLKGDVSSRELLEKTITEYLFVVAESKSLERVLGDAGALAAYKNAKDEAKLECATKLQAILNETFDRSRHLNTNGTFKHEKRHRAFLRFEAEKGFILRPEQFETINKILDNPNALEELRMGLGKSAVIFPMCAKLLTTPTTHCIVIYTEELLRQSAKELDPRAYLLEFDRNANLSPEQLDSLYLTILNARKQGKYMITTIGRIAAMQNKMVELLSQIKDLKQQFAQDDITINSLKIAIAGNPLNKTDLEKQLATLQQKITGLALQLSTLRTQHSKLARIHGTLTDNKTRFLIDEVDEVLDISSDKNYSLGAPEKINSTSIHACEVVFSSGNLINALRDKSLTSLSPDKQKELREAIASDILVELKANNPLFTDIEVTDDVTEFLIDSEKDFKDLTLKLSPEAEKQLGAIRHVLLKTLPGVFNKEMGKDYGFAADQMQVAPRKAERIKPNTSYGEEYEFLAYHYAAYCKNFPSKEVFDNCINHPDFNALKVKLMNATTQNMSGFDVGSITQEDLFNTLNISDNERLRMEFLTLLLTKTNYILRFKRQIKRNVQQVLQKNTAGASGTMNRYAMPIMFHSDSRMKPPPRVTTADLILRITGNDPTRLNEKVGLFDDPIKQFKDLAGKKDCKAIINTSLSLDRPMKELIGELRQGNNRDWIYLDSTTRQTWIWKAGEDSPQLFDKQKDPVPPNVLFYFAPADIIGTDFKIPFGYGALVVGPTTQLTQFEQAAWRLRQLGNGQTIKLFAPTNLFPGQEPTILDVVKRVVGKISDEIENQDVKALGSWPRNIAINAIENLIFSDHPSELKEELFNIAEDHFIEEININYLQELAESNPVAATQYFQKIVQKQRDELAKIESKLKAIHKYRPPETKKSDQDFMNMLNAVLSGAHFKLNTLEEEFSKNINLHYEALPQTINQASLEGGSETETTTEQTTQSLSETQAETSKQPVITRPQSITGDNLFPNFNNADSSTGFAAMQLSKVQEIPELSDISELSGLYFAPGFKGLWENVNPNCLSSVFFASSIVTGQDNSFSPRVTLVSTNNLPTLALDANTKSLGKTTGMAVDTPTGLYEPLPKDPLLENAILYSLPQQGKASLIAAGTSPQEYYAALASKANELAVQAKNLAQEENLEEASKKAHKLTSEASIFRNYVKEDYLPLLPDYRDDIETPTLENYKEYATEMEKHLLEIPSMIQGKETQCKRLEIAGKILAGFDEFPAEEQNELKDFLGNGLSIQSKIQFKALLERKNMCPKIREQLSVLIESRKTK